MPSQPQPVPTPSRPAPISTSTDPWTRVLDHAAASNRRLRVLLDDVSLHTIADDLVVLTVSEALFGAAQSSEKDLGAVIAKAWDRAVRLELRRNTPLFAPTDPASTSATNTTPAEPPVQDHPLVQQAMKTFNAKLVGVQPRKNPNAGG